MVCTSLIHAVGQATNSVVQDAWVQAFVEKRLTEQRVAQRSAARDVKLNTPRDVKLITAQRAVPVL